MHVSANQQQAKGRTERPLPKNLEEAKAWSTAEQARLDDLAKQAAQKQLESDPAYQASKQLAADQARQRAEAIKSEQAAREDDKVDKTFRAITGALKEPTISLLAEAMTQRGLEREVALADDANGWKRSLQTVTDPASGKLLRAELTETHSNQPGSAPSERSYRVEVTQSRFRNEDLSKGGVELAGNRWLRKLFSVSSEVPSVRYSQSLKIPLQRNVSPGRFAPTQPDAYGHSRQQQMSVAVGSSVANREIDFAYEYNANASRGAGYSSDGGAFEPIPEKESARQAELAIG